MAVGPLDHKIALPEQAGVLGGIIKAPPDGECVVEMDEVTGGVLLALGGGFGRIMIDPSGHA